VASFVEIPPVSKNTVSRKISVKGTENITLLPQQRIQRWGQSTRCMFFMECQRELA